MTYDKDLNYCTNSPDKLFNVNFNYACYLHDRQYRNEVKQRKTRYEADRDLRDFIFGIFKKNNKIIRGYIISRIYYCAVRMFSGKFWD